jgi:hypothetical protein
VNRRRPATRTQVLRWLLVIVTLVGAGILQGGHCLPHTVPMANVMTVTVAAAHPSTAGSGGHEHHDADSSVAQHPDTTVDDCHLQPAPNIAATVTSGTVAPPIIAIRISPVPVPVPVSKPRAPVAVALTEIGISRI